MSAGKASNPAETRSPRFKTPGGRKLWSGVAAALALGILIGAVFSGGLLSAAGSPHSGASNPKNQGVSLSGVETIKVLGADGRVISSWTGPDPLTPLAIGSMVACITGPESSSPWIVSNGNGGYTPICGAWIQTGAFAVFWGCSVTGSFNDGATAFPVSSCAGSSTQAVTNTPTPVGCSLTPLPYQGNPPPCTGWISQATFAPATYCSNACGLDAVALGDASMGTTSGGISGNGLTGNVFDCLADGGGVGVCNSLMGVPFGSPWPSAQPGSLTGSAFTGSAVTLVVSISFTVT